MAAILRVKRKKDDEPLDALLISCKRPKIDCEEAASVTPVTAIVKFAGTVEKEDDCVIQHITKNLTKDELKAHYKQHIIDVTSKVRENVKQKSNENRYKIVNTMRSLDSSLAEQLEEDVVNIIDIENTKVIPDDMQADSYVYDLYYTQTKEEIQLENLVSILPVEQNLVFEDCYENELDNESEDSNSESNWRNDYPDSDHSDDSIGEAAISRAMQNMNVKNELSSDDEDFAYGLEEDIVNRYGYKYAKYKLRMKQEKHEYEKPINPNDPLNEIDENDENYHEDDFCFDDENSQESENECLD